MARKRRKRRSDDNGPSPVRPAAPPEAIPPSAGPHVEGTASGHAEARLDELWGDSDPGLDASDGVVRKSDQSCLSHPSYDLEHVCDDCAASMCGVCAIQFGAARLCADCFEVRVGRRRRGGSWHGWVALAAGLFALGAVVAPFTLAVDPEVARAFPGGRAFFIYGSSFTAGLAVLFGLGAQDYNGFGKRAGVVAVVLGALAFCAILVMNLVVAFGS